MEAVAKSKMQTVHRRNRSQEHTFTEANKLCLRFLSRSENVSLARLLAAGVAAEQQLTVADLDEIKVAVSEAVSNAIIHGYQNRNDCYIEMSMALTDTRLVISIHDDGVGIKDVEKAIRPSYSGCERMGLGFAFMHSFMDEVEVNSTPGQGTTVTLYKNMP